MQFFFQSYIYIDTELTKFFVEKSYAEFERFSAYFCGKFL